MLVDDGADEGFAVAAGDVGDNVGGDGANQPDVIDLTGETDDDTDAGDEEVAMLLEAGNLFSLLIEFDRKLLRVVSS